MKDCSGCFHIITKDVWVGIGFTPTITLLLLVILLTVIGTKFSNYLFFNFPRFELGEPASPFEQLLAVFPKQSAHAIPQCFRHLLSDPSSEIIDFYPTSFEFDLNGAPYVWMGVNLLPFIDRERLIAAMKKHEHKLTETEK